MKILSSIGGKLLIAGFVLWLSETIAFLIVEGWHINATSEDEITLDLVSMAIIKLGFIFQGAAILLYFDKLIKES